MAVDAMGQTYVTGYTLSPDFPTTADAFDPICGTDGYCNSNPLFDDYSDVFVTKLNAAGSALVYSTFLGGAGQDRGVSLAVDAVGQAYVTGSTLSFDFPTTPGAFDITCGTDGNCNPDGYESSDVFVTKLDAAGALVYSTFLGGELTEGGESIAVDAAGQAY